jgi:hypothetical protein
MIMRAFMESKDRFLFQLRLPDVIEAIRLSGVPEIPDPDRIDAALDRLCAWGNLQHALPERSVLIDPLPRAKTRAALPLSEGESKATLPLIQGESRPGGAAGGRSQAVLQHAYRLTAQGEAAEKALAAFDPSGPEHDLQQTTLSDIQRCLQNLLRLSETTPPDTLQLHSNLLLLQARFQTLRTTAQTLIARLEIDIPAQSADQQRLIEFSQRCVGELVLAADVIGQAIRDIEDAAEPRIHDSTEMKSHWDCLRRWFIPEPGRPSYAELFRERARALITARLSAIARINDRRVHRIDRASDFCVLARWFAQAPSDADAHRLWRSMFGLSPARHLIVNDRTLDDHEIHAVPANTSWLDAPPLRISKRFRHHRNSPQTGMLSRIIDRAADKEKLAAATHEEALRLLQAQSRFGRGHRLRLSELENLETGEFDMLLDLLGEAVSARVFSSEAVEILSADGSLSVRLEPTDDGREAMILTNDGMLSGPDQWIRIDPILTERNVEMQRC